MSTLQTSKTIIQTICPACGKSESLLITTSELAFAQDNHSLITKAVSHIDEGHVLTLYIDGQGLVRRKYCFDIAEKKQGSLQDSLLKNLNSVFDQMIKNSMKP